MPYVTTVKPHHLTGKAQDEQSYSVALSRPTPQGEYHGTLDGQSFSLDWQQISLLAKNTRETDGGRYTLLVAGVSYEVFVQRIPDAEADKHGSRTYEIHLAQQVFTVTVEDERTHMLESLSRRSANSAIAKVQAPMPGLVVNTLVTPGETVQAGQTVVILEAMKMENDLPAPIAGTVKEVKIAQGDTVDNGQVLVTIEP